MKVTKHDIAIGIIGFGLLANSLGDLRRNDDVGKAVERDVEVFDHLTALTQAVTTHSEAIAAQDKAIAALDEACGDEDGCTLAPTTEVPE